MLDGPSSYSLQLSFWTFCIKVKCSIHCCPCGERCHDDPNACCLCKKYQETVREYYDSSTTSTTTTTTTTTTTAAPTTTHKPKSCFPGVARVHLENGNLIEMSDLKAGDLVQTGL